MTRIPMSPVAQEMIEKASEYFEMTEYPAVMLVEMLSKEVVRLRDRIDYLDKRVKHMERNQTV